MSAKSDAPRAKAAKGKNVLRKKLAKSLWLLDNPSEKDGDKTAAAAQAKELWLKDRKDYMKKAVKMQAALKSRGISLVESELSSDPS